MHICELSHLAQGSDNSSKEQKIVPYVASARCRHDVQALTKVGWSSEDISRGLDINLSFVKSQQARIERHDAERRRFITSGRIPEYYEPGMPKVFPIYQK
jgi:hypothetical protein